MKDLFNKALAWAIVCTGLSACMMVFFIFCCGILDGWWL